MKKLLLIILMSFAILSAISCSDKGTGSDTDIVINEEPGDTPSIPE